MGAEPNDCPFEVDEAKDHLARISAGDRDSFLSNVEDIGGERLSTSVIRFILPEVDPGVTTRDTL